MSSSTSFTNSKALPRLPVVHEVFGREFLPEPCVDLAFAHGLPGTVQGATSGLEDHVMGIRFVLYILSYVYYHIIYNIIYVILYYIS